MKVHNEDHPLTRQTVLLGERAADPIRGMVAAGKRAYVEGWWDVLTNGSWMDAQGNMACLQYAMRSAAAGLPLDDEVVYVKIATSDEPRAIELGHLVHVSELGDPVDG